MIIDIPVKNYNKLKKYADLLGLEPEEVVMHLINENQQRMDDFIHDMTVRDLYGNNDNSKHV